jgi:hypothetical protein
MDVKADSNIGGFYRIRIEGFLDPEWVEWFDGVSLQHLGSESILTVFVLDQAALFGILNKIRDLGLAFHSVERQRSGLMD